MSCIIYLFSENILIQLSLYPIKTLIIINRKHWMKVLLLKKRINPIKYWIPCLLQGITRVNGKLIGYHYELGFIRRFDFSSKLKRMSAVVENAKLELLLVILKVPQKK